MLNMRNYLYNELSQRRAGKNQVKSRKNREMSTRNQPEPGSEEKDRHAPGKEHEAGNVLMPVTARGEATRRKILDAAEEVFGELGYYEASIAEITRHASVAQGTYYIYFHSKREIFAELVEDIGERLRAEMRAAIAGASDRLEVERRGFEAFFHFVARHRRIYSIVQEAERVTPEAFYAYYHKISQGYIRGLQEAMEDGSVRNLDPEAIAYTLMGIGHFIALRWLIWPHDSETQPGNQEALPPDVFESIMDFITHALAPSKSE